MMPLRPCPPKTPPEPGGSSGGGPGSGAGPGGGGGSGGCGAKDLTPRLLLATKPEGAALADAPAPVSADNQSLESVLNELQ